MKAFLRRVLLAVLADPKTEPDTRHLAARALARFEGPRAHELPIPPDWFVDQLTRGLVERGWQRGSDNPAADPDTSLAAAVAAVLVTMRSPAGRPVLATSARAGIGVAA